MAVNHSLSGHKIRGRAFSSSHLTDLLDEIAEWVFDVGSECVMNIDITTVDYSVWMGTVYYDKARKGPDISAKILKDLIEGGVGDDPL